MWYKNKHNPRIPLVVFAGVLFIFIGSISLRAQFWGQASSSDGYTVDFLIVPTTIDAPVFCPSGYNFNVNLLYIMTFSGTNIPDSLTTVWGEVDCGSYTVNTFELPKEGGTGTSRTNTSPYRSTPDCLIATPATLFCLTIRVYVSGPGMPEEEVILTGSLPITMGSFSGEVRESTVELNWTTLGEQDNDFFTIERSTDLVEWQLIGEQDGAGTCSQEMCYSFTDKTPLDGFNYYRIRQTDFNGMSTTSTVQSVEFHSAVATIFQLYPIPVTDRLFIQSNVDLSGMVLISDQLGNTIMQFLFDDEPATIRSISVKDLEPGIYILSNRGRSERFVKQ